MSSLQTPFLDLFEMLRDAGMSLSLEQYNLLTQALARGYGLGGWDELRRVCHLLWVKPSPNASKELFNRTFERYIQQYHPTAPVSPSNFSPQKPNSIRLGELPRLPPRKSVEQENGNTQAPIAIQTAPPVLPAINQKQFQLTPVDIPVSLEEVQRVWRSLRCRVRVGNLYEPDPEATMAKIEREGLFGDIVLRPVLTRAAQLLLLVDDSNATIPFQPAFQPFITAVETGRIHPAQIYRFTNYPNDFLYPWRNSSPTEALANTK
ncbi:MAG: hypothetical protein F6K09_31600, partial [Merismopedia sp. SIO2A8]|nr:hypothetical protein [Merismopedia sp. SIO2A8]